MIYIYAFIIVIGFIPFFIILYRMRKVIKLKETGVKVMATVTEIKGYRSRSMNSVIIEYDIPGTNTFCRKEINVGGSPYQIGQQLPLYYKKDNPLEMQLDSGKSFIILIIFTLILAAFAIFACYMINQGIETGTL